MADNQNLQPTQVIAKIFGVTTRRVQQLKDEGIIQGQGNPMRFDLLPTIQSYIRYLSDKANGREKKEAMAKLEEDKLRAEAEIKQAKAKQSQMELKELQGKLHRAEDVEAIFTDHVMFLRSMLMALPGKLAVDLAGTHTAAEQAERVKKEVYFILNSLADHQYNPEEYKRRVMERKGWESHREDDDDGD